MGMLDCFCRSGRVGHEDGKHDKEGNVNNNASEATIPRKKRAAPPPPIKTSELANNALSERIALYGDVSEKDSSNALSVSRDSSYSSVGDNAEFPLSPLGFAIMRHPSENNLSPADGASASSEAPKPSWSQASPSAAQTMMRMGGVSQALGHLAVLASHSIFNKNKKGASSSSSPASSISSTPSSNSGSSSASSSFSLPPRQSLSHSIAVLSPQQQNARNSNAVNGSVAVNIASGLSAAASTAITSVIPFAEAGAARVIGSISGRPSRSSLSSKAIVHPDRQSPASPSSSLSSPKPKSSIPPVQSYNPSSAAAPSPLAAGSRASAANPAQTANDALPKQTPSQSPADDVHNLRGRKNSRRASICDTAPKPSNSLVGGGGREGSGHKSAAPDAAAATPGSVAPSGGRMKRRSSISTTPLSAFNSDAFLKEKSFKFSISAHQDVDEEGLTYINEYCMLQKLGEGSFGKVKLALNITNNQTYAIKMCSKTQLRQIRVSDRETGLINMRREIAIMKSLQHPNVVRLYEVIDDQLGDKIFLVMEYLSKGAVATSDKYGNSKEGVFKEHQARRYFRDLIAGVTYLHSMHIVHQDIKIENLLLDAGDNIKVADFGTAKRFEGEDDSCHIEVGTPTYWAPENFKPGARSGRGLDVWACGVTLYAFVVGKLPFFGASLSDIRTALEQPLDLSSIDDGELKDLLIGLLQKDPKNRIRLDAASRHPWVIRHSNEYDSASGSDSSQNMSKSDGDGDNSARHSHGVQFNAQNAAAVAGPPSMELLSRDTFSILQPSSSGSAVDNGNRPAADISSILPHSASSSSFQASNSLLSAASAASGLDSAASSSASLISMTAGSKNNSSQSSNSSSSGPSLRTPVANNSSSFGSPSNIHVRSAWSSASSASLHAAPAAASGAAQQQQQSQQLQPLILSEVSADSSLRLPKAPSGHSKNLSSNSVAASVIAGSVVSSSSAVGAVEPPTRHERSHTHGGERSHSIKRHGSQSAAHQQHSDALQLKMEEVMKRNTSVNVRARLRRPSLSEEACRIGSFVAPRLRKPEEVRPLGGGSYYYQKQKEKEERDNEPSPEAFLSARSRKDQEKEIEARQESMMSPIASLTHKGVSIRRPSLKWDRDLLGRVLQKSRAEPKSSSSGDDEKPRAHSKEKERKIQSGSFLRKRSSKNLSSSLPPPPPQSLPTAVLYAPQPLITSAPPSVFAAADSSLYAQPSHASSVYPSPATTIALVANASMIAHMSNILQNGSPSASPASPPSGSVSQSPSNQSPSLALARLLLPGEIDNRYSVDTFVSVATRESMDLSRSSSEAMSADDEGKSQRSSRGSRRSNSSSNSRVVRDSADSAYYSDQSFNSSNNSSPLQRNSSLQRVSSQSSLLAILHASNLSSIISPSSAAVPASSASAITASPLRMMSASSLLSLSPSSPDTPSPAILKDQSTSILSPFSLLAPLPAIHPHVSHQSHDHDQAAPRNNFSPSSPGHPSNKNQASNSGGLSSSGRLPSGRLISASPHVSPDVGAALLLVQSPPLPLLDMQKVHTATRVAGERQQANLAKVNERDLFFENEDSEEEEEEVPEITAHALKKGESIMVKVRAPEESLKPAFEFLSRTQSSKQGNLNKLVRGESASPAPAPAASVPSREPIEMLAQLSLYPSRPSPSMVPVANALAAHPAIPFEFEIADKTYLRQPRRSSMPATAPLLPVQPPSPSDDVYSPDLDFDDDPFVPGGADAFDYAELANYRFGGSPVQSNTTPSRSLLEPK